MRLDSIISTAIDHVVWPMLRRLLVALAVGLFALIAIYHFTVAGNIALAGEYGDVNARLIIGGIYAALALTCLAILWALRGGSTKPARAPSLQNPHEKQLAMLIEAATLGYTRARKGQRAR
jgi:type VI protein secretion system component VasK